MKMCRNRLFPSLLIIFSFVSLNLVNCQEPQDEDTGVLPSEFAPVVTAICRGGSMIVTVNTGNPFYGAIHSANLRRSPCIQEGTGSNTVQISFSMNAIASDSDYCGVISNNRTGEKSVQLAVRAHRTLELAEDKQYVVTCGKAGFKNNRNNDTWSVKMGFYHGSRHVQEVFQGRPYTLRVELSKSPEFSIRVRSCFSFGANDTFVPLVDDNGCPERGVISRWTYSPNNQQAEATIYSMFRFADSKRLNFQCDVLLCQEEQCPNPKCESVPALLHVVPQRQRDTNDTSVLVSTAVYVLEPGDKPELLALEEECSGIYPKWLLWLAITLGVLFLIMLLINLFLCSALTCTCTRTELIEKEPSVLEDYDPYRSWAGSQYGGSRYSLNGGGGKPIYSISAESNGGSDHYATVPSRHSPSRPGSRYSNSNGNRINSSAGGGHGGSPYGNNRKIMY